MAATLIGLIAAAAAATLIDLIGLIASAKSSLIVTMHVMEGGMVAAPVGDLMTGSDPDVFAIAILMMTISGGCNGDVFVTGISMMTTFGGSSEGAFY